MENYIITLRESLKPELRHMPLLQDGAAVIVENPEGKILLQHRADRDEWGVPGGCQEMPNQEAEQLEVTATRELYEEAGIKTRIEDLILIGMISGKSRYNKYPNGDIVYNNTALFLTTSYTGSIKIDEESREMRFFNIHELPSNLMDQDLIDCYKRYRSKNPRKNDA